MIKVIIGLPCSGKTHLCKKYAECGYKIYDDFISTLYNGELLSDSQKYDKICISDPRLCVFEIFSKIISRFGEKRIHITLFENDPKSCLKNLILRGGNEKEVSHSIEFLSSKYLLTNYDKFEREVIPVYAQQL